MKKALALLFLAVWLLGAPRAFAQEAAAATGLDAELEKQVREIALSASHPREADDEAARDTGPAAAPRVEVVVGRLDPRLRLAPCQRIEPYLPEGARAWGRSRIGLRCAQGAVKWNVYLPVTVKVWGRALVAANGLSAGSVLSAADVAQAEVDLAEDASAPLVDAQAVVGRTLARSLAPGQSLRASHLKARQYFTAGEPVTVLARGAGFSVAGEAVALSNGIEGQVARVRTDSGRVLAGMPVAERRVEIGL
jgi:flagella basal body P-ring formation protein FlgA